MTHLHDTPLSLEELLSETDSGSGAWLLFAGTVREHNEGQAVDGMNYSAHRPLAEKVLAEIETEALEKFDIRGCRILHRLGDLQLGDASVLIAVRSAHRAAAYEASRYAIEELKVRAPIFKQEHYVDGDSTWLEGTPLKDET